MDTSNLVSGRISSLMGSDNPIIQRARTGAAQSANARGLLNSSMASQAGEEAALGSATTLANSDFDAQAKANQLQWQADSDANTKNSYNFLGYSQAMQNILSSNIENKTDATNTINRMYFGNNSGTGDFSLKLNPMKFTW